MTRQSPISQNVENQAIGLSVAYHELTASPSDVPVLLLQLAHILTLAIVAAFTERVSSVLLFASGCCNIGLYAVLVWHEIRRPQAEVSPLLLFLISGILRLGIGSCWAAIVYHLGYVKPFTFGMFNVAGNLMVGQLLLVTGDWCLIVAYLFTQRHMSSRPFNSPIDDRKQVRDGIGLILIGWAVKAAIFVGIPLPALGMLFVLLGSYSVPAGVYLLLIGSKGSNDRKSMSRLAMIALVITAELALALRSYMKTSVLIIMIPFLAYMLREIKERKFSARPLVRAREILVCGVIGFFILFVLFPYSQLRRGEFWDDGEAAEVPAVMPYLTQALTHSIPTTRSFGETHSLPDRGGWAFAARHGDVLSAAFSRQVVETTGIIRGRFMTAALVNCIPRVAWPDKPLYSPGRDVWVMMGMADDAEDATNAVHLGGLPGSLYLNWGTTGLIIGTLLNGVILCWTWRFARCYLYFHPIAAVLMILLYHQSLAHFESEMSGGISTYTYVVFFIVPLLLITRRLFVRDALRQA